MGQSKFRKKALSPSFYLFLFSKLPLAFVAGVRIKEFTAKECVTTIKYRWINQNPFGSLYFAAMQMAAELTTGLLLFQYRTKDKPFSMLLVSVTAPYSKKAVGRVQFTCAQGQDVTTFVDQMRVDSGEGTIHLNVIATDNSNEEVAQFTFSWSCKMK